MRPTPRSSHRGAADWFLIGIIAAVALASVAPQLGRTGGVFHLDLIGNVGIVIVFFLHGMGLSTERLREGASRWRLHLLVQLCTFAAFPLWWWLLSRVVGAHVPHELVLGFFFLAVLPSTLSSSVALTGVAGGNVAAAMLNATLSTLLGVILTPLLASLVFGQAGGTGHSMDLWDTMRKVALMLLLPFVAGQLLRPWLGAWFQRIHSRTMALDRAMILLLVWSSFSDSVADGLWSKYGIALIGMALAGVLLFLLPMLWFTRVVARWMGLPVTDEIVAVFCGSKKSLASGIPMARLLFGGDPALGLLVLPIIFYHQIQLFVCSLMARRYAKRRVGPPSLSEPAGGSRP
ncbi:MAG: hypothetical protein RLZZ618_295 [Pseudomonadota bacterium]|jgi:sodium/bile acid cotransporter 7